MAIVRARVDRTFPGMLRESSPKEDDEFIVFTAVSVVKFRACRHRHDDANGMSLSPHF